MVDDVFIGLVLKHPAVEHDVVVVLVVFTVLEVVDHRQFGRVVLQQHLHGNRRLQAAAHGQGRQVHELIFNYH